MPLAEAEALAAAGNVGRVSLALYAEVVNLRAQLDQAESHALEAERTRATGGPAWPCATTWANEHTVPPPESASRHDMAPPARYQASNEGAGQ